VYWYPPEKRKTLSKNKKTPEKEEQMATDDRLH